MAIIPVTYIAPNHPHLLEFCLLTLLRIQIKQIKLRLEKTVSYALPILALCHLSKTKFCPMVLEKSKLNLAPDCASDNIMCEYSSLPRYRKM